MNKNHTGVYIAQKSDGSIYYRASITYRRKHISLGSCSTPEDAHQIYLEADHALHDEKLQLTDYRETMALSFDKWVSLINFRDNGIYIATPIYIYRRMISYYLSPTEVFKFDADELFFYSSHKIMRRGGHYFVADYGMQVNLPNRYGIRSYAVNGRDYRFKNKDPMDFRSTNLEIINHYNGVTKERIKGKDVYRARIHVRGNYIIGDYAEEDIAAIAYNKAADLLQEAGSTKKYIRNYIDGMEKEQYKSIYGEVELSENLLQLAETFTPSS